MTKNIPFDTLQYAQLLKICGVGDPEGQSVALATVITESMYTKNEVDNMIEAALKRFDERTYALDKRIDLNFKEMENRIGNVEAHIGSRLDKVDVQIAKVDSRIDSVAARNLYWTIGVLGTMIMLATTINSFAHYFSH